MSLLIPAPRSPRELLTAFAHYDEQRGIEGFLDAFDFHGVTPHQVYYSVLGRLPESVQAARMAADYDARRHMHDAIASPEFQRNFIGTVLHSFPEKQRVFFVHVPKCAGSDLAKHLLERYPDGCLKQKILRPAYVPGAKARRQLQRLMAKLPEREQIVVMGHFALDGFLSRGLIRYGDVAFSVVRDPISMALSVVNYALTLMELEPQDRPLVALGFIKALNLRMDTHGLPADPAARKQLALQLLHDPKVVPANNLCNFLGRGNADSAFELCATANIELTTVSRYEAWLQQRWGVRKSERANASRQYLRHEDLSADDLAYLHERSQEDRRFYERIDKQLTSSDQLSLFGAQL